MDLLSLLSGLIHGAGIGGAGKAVAHQAAQQAPDITYDPSGRLPYSAKTPALAQEGNAYTANPTAPQFLGVDPAQFGYPADNTVQPQGLHLLPPWMNNFQIQGSQNATQPAAQPNLLQNIGSGNLKAIHGARDPRLSLQSGANFYTGGDPLTIPRR